MNDSISITVPMTSKALMAASQMFSDLADDVVIAPQNVKPSLSIVKNDENLIVATEEPDHQSIPNLDEPHAVELDNDGVPWDERIHSSSHGKTAKGVWKKRKNLPDGLYETVMAELKAVEANDDVALGLLDETDGSVVEETTPKKPTPPPKKKATPPPAPKVQMTKMYVIEGEQYSKDDLTAEGWTDEDIATLEYVETPVEGNVTELTFPELLKKVKTGIEAGTFTQMDVNAACQASGVASIALVAGQPQLIPAIHLALFGE